MDTADWIGHFDGLDRLPPDLREALLRGAKVVRLPAGAEVFHPGQSADNLLLLVEGTVRVQQRSENGREIFLYRVHAGETCVLTTACMLALEEYAAEGIAETDVTAIAIPRKTFDELAARSSVFREFVFRAYSRRITDLFTLIDQIVFQRMDVRLATRLLELAQDGVVRATHQALGVELGTAREVISRTLAEFQRRGFVEQGRGTIRILDRAGLTRLAQSGADR